ncbi:hemicentin [Paragonimus westermani]|uniref:Hemicentin n=1 Tax=Paragonimus westermani TaxID=34504 RepID=A0A5J4NWC6_9TREM|nr:hemicentin [Paragonimus westermani]
MFYVIQDTTEHPRSGLFYGNLRGHLNKVDIGIIPFNVSWDSPVSGGPTVFQFQLDNLLPEHIVCVQAMSELYTPAMWYAAQENSSKAVLQLDAYLTGSCPLSLSDATQKMSETVIRLHDFRENIVQLNPHKGELHAQSSRVFGVKKSDDRRFQIEPHQWTSSIQTGQGRRQRYLNQEMNVNRILLEPDVRKRTVRLRAEAYITKPTAGEICPSGFELHRTRFSGPDSGLEAFRDYCQDVDECSSRTLNKCDHVCENTVPHYTCACHTGYRLSADGHTCVDVDECANPSTSPCQADQRCVNMPGGFECRRACGLGLRESATGEGCEDIDECAEGAANQCRENERCINLPGTYKCHAACPFGYRALHSNLSANTIECADLDECAMGTFTCPAGARCWNEPGSYSCRCPNGGIATARGCDDRTGTVCNEGFQWDELKGCVDVNECQHSSGLGPCQFKCVNTYGGFYCECPQGYQLEPRTNTCKDIDECESFSQPCGFDEFCLNVPGNYTCVKKECPKNYVFDHRSR